jgi:hypothetical protein
MGNYGMNGCLPVASPALGGAAQLRKTAKGHVFGVMSIHPPYPQAQAQPSTSTSVQDQQGIISRPDLAEGPISFPSKSFPANTCFHTNS